MDHISPIVVLAIAESMLQQASIHSQFLDTVVKLMCNDQYEQDYSWTKLLWQNASPLVARCI